MLSSNFEEENLISKIDLQKHNIQKYEFKSIAKNVQESIISEPVLQTTHVANESNDNSEENKKQPPSLEKDLIERLLQKTDELSGNLAKLQIQFEKQQLEMEERINTARNDAYKDGLKEGEEKTKKELLSQVEKEKSTLIQSAITLEEQMKKSQIHLQDLEKELSGIAIDIAKEVIVKEIEESSQKVALALAKELLSSISDATDIYIKVNTIDYPYINEQLKDVQKLHIQADDAISKGGIVLSCSSGNIDGNIMTRYKNLKQSVLENL